VPVSSLGGGVTGGADTVTTVVVPAGACGCCAKTLATAAFDNPGSLAGGGLVGGVIAAPPNAEFTPKWMPSPPMPPRRTRMGGGVTEVCGRPAGTTRRMLYFPVLAAPLKLLNS